MKVAVVGSGNGSYAAAAEFALAGHEVRMIPGRPAEHGDLLQDQAITLTGVQGEGRALLDRATDDPAEALEGSDVVVCSDPAVTQKKRARLLAPHLRPEQIVMLSPGSLGSLVFARTVREEGGPDDLTFAEPGTLPYLARKTASATVNISGTAVHLPIGVYPADRSDEALKQLRLLYPTAHAVENALSVFLLNVGPVIHSVLVLLNTGPIEHLDSWDIHHEGSSPSVIKLILALDDERIALREYLGFRSHHYPIRDHYEPGEDREWMYGRRGRNDLVQSGDWQEKLSYEHRYIQEDVRTNLTLLSSVGRLCGVPTPIADSILILVGRIVGQDFRETGRTLESVGLGGRSVAEVMRLMEIGHEVGRGRPEDAHTGYGHA